MESCPCGSSITYAQCCERFIEQHLTPATPEELMRSRYTAYTRANLDYIAKTMKGAALIDFDREHAKEWSEQLVWQKLKIIQSDYDENHGSVEYMAFYSHAGNNDIIYEISEFECENGIWYYTDGATPKIGRNDNCPCGSDSKYKKCCGR